MTLLRRNTPIQASEPREASLETPNFRLKFVQSWSPRAGAPELITRQLMCLDTQARLRRHSVLTKDRQVTWDKNNNLAGYRAVDAEEAKLHI